MKNSKTTHKKTFIFLTLACFMFLLQKEIKSQGLGGLLIREMASLIVYSEIGNIGSRDPECRSAQFPTSNINNLIESEVRGYLNEMSRRDSRSRQSANNDQLNSIIRDLHQLINQRIDGVLITKSTYSEIKSRARASHGSSAFCSVTSAAIETVIHQKRLSIRNIIQEVR